MKYSIDYEATIQEFFDAAIAWLDGRPARLRCGVNQLNVARQYMQMVKSDPKKYTANNHMYANCDKLEGFYEYSVDRDFRLITRSDLYIVVLQTLDAIGQYYKNNNRDTQSILMESIKRFYIVSNRKNTMKNMLYRLRAPRYFAQKQK